MDIAHESIRGGLVGGGPAVPTSQGPDDPLFAPRAAFVTVFLRDELNGCIGSVEPQAALAVSVARHAWAAAFDDPRLPPLTIDDYEFARLKISVLSELRPVTAASDDELLDQLRPGTDGLLLRWRGRRATFLPAVWESLPSPAAFLRHLRAKAGLPPARWLEGTEAWVYGTEEFGSDL